jgi:hypothetical protein
MLLMFSMYMLPLPSRSQCERSVVIPVFIVFGQRDPWGRLVHWLLVLANRNSGLEML